MVSKETVISSRRTNQPAASRSKESVVPSPQSSETDRPILMRCVGERRSEAMK